MSWRSSALGPKISTLLRVSERSSRGATRLNENLRKHFSAAKNVEEPASDELFTELAAMTSV
jgi:hypothetical protein